MYILTSPDDWRDVMRAQLEIRGTSIYSLSREAAGMEICSAHTAACLLATAGTSRAGNRAPSLANAIALAGLAECDLVLVPRKRRRRKA
jgi:hypothetical protein